MSPIAITLDNHQEAVVDSPQPVLLQFWAATCVPCMLMKRTVAKAAESFGNGVRVGLVNAEDQAELVEKYGVRGTPTFAVVVGGRAVQIFTGVSTASGLVKRVHRILE